jgi:hypothetical protein
MKRPKSILIIFLVIFLLFGFYLVKAAEPTTTLMTLIKCEKYGGGVGGCLQAIYNLGVQVAVALAFLMIIIGGIEYMLSTTVPGKLRGKQRIVDAIIGLSIIFLSGTVLYWINPKIFQAMLVLPVIRISPKEGAEEKGPEITQPGLTYSSSSLEQKRLFASQRLNILLKCIDEATKRRSTSQGRIVGAIVTAIVDNFTLKNAAYCFRLDEIKNKKRERWRDEFNNPNKCVHAWNSCHYGGANRCKEGGVQYGYVSYSVDFDAPAPMLEEIKKIIINECKGSAIIHIGTTGGLHLHADAGLNNDDYLRNTCGCPRLGSGNY